MPSKHKGICPFCKEEIVPYVIDENTFRRDVCACPECREKILVCRGLGCHNYAKGGESYDDELCPECTKSLADHAGDIVKGGLVVALSIAVTSLSEKDSD